MAEKRSKLQISTQILMAIFNNQGKARPTHIQYKANLSYKILSNYLNDLIGRGLIEKKNIKGRNFFVLTEKGKEFLVGVKQVKEFTQSFGFEV
jgi:predicted transcriptional regulator